METFSEVKDVQKFLRNERIRRGLRQEDVGRAMVPGAYVDRSQYRDYVYKLEASSREIKFQRLQAWADAMGYELTFTMKEKDV